MAKQSRAPLALTPVLALALSPPLAHAAAEGLGAAAPAGGNGEPYEASLAILVAVGLLLVSALVTRTLLRLKAATSYAWILPVLGLASGAAWAGLHFSGLEGMTWVVRVLRFLCLLAAFLCVLYWVVRLALPSAARRTRAGVPPLIRNLAILVCALLAFVTLLRWCFPELSLTPLLVTSGAVSIVVGLAVQDMLTNVLAGVVLSTDQPFRVGDWIRIGDVEGAVAQIGWRATKILTREEDHVNVPNWTIVKERVTNFDQPSSLHVRPVHVAVSYETPPALAVNALLEAASRVEGVLKSPRPHVHFRDYLDSSLLYELRVFIDNFASAYAVESEVRKEIWYSFKRHGITIPFPQRDVNFRKAPEGPQQTCARLVVSSGLPPGWFFELGEGTTAIGRAPDNDICIPDQRVSGRHAVIEWHDGEFVLQDVGSSRGTRVNGTVIKSATLSQGDVIKVGSVALIFEQNRAPESAGVRSWMYGALGLDRPAGNDEKTAGEADETA
jgi:small-conductance mechanosensitive channel